MAKVAIVVRLAGLIFSALFSVFAYDLLVSALYLPCTGWRRTLVIRFPHERLSPITGHHGHRE